MSDHTVTKQKLKTLLRLGAGNARSARDLGQVLGCSERMVGKFVEELISEEGLLIGSLCDADNHGYFLIGDRLDLELGTAHIVARAKKSFVRVSRLKKAAMERFGDAEGIARLFDLEEVG